MEKNIKQQQKKIKHVTIRGLPSRCNIPANLPSGTSTCSTNTTAHSSQQPINQSHSEGGGHASVSFYLNHLFQCDPHPGCGAPVAWHFLPRSVVCSVHLGLTLNKGLKAVRPVPPVPPDGALPSLRRVGGRGWEWEWEGGYGGREAGY